MGKRIAYVTTTRSKISNRGDIWVSYVDGTSRHYRPETLPRTVADFCVMAKRCTKEEDFSDIYHTYYNI